jgi:hypothetical protein
MSFLARKINCAKWTAGSAAEAKIPPDVSADISLENFKYRGKTPKVRKSDLVRLPWPRVADDDPNVRLGIDINKNQQDIIKIVHKFFKVKEIPMEELLQEVYLAIMHKNYTRSAHDPRKSSLGHYIYMIANNVCINLVHKQKRRDKECESLDAPCHSDDTRTLMEIVEDSNEPNVETDDKFSEKLEELEISLRFAGKRDVARYVRAVRLGMRPEIIKEALSWGNRKMSNKDIRDIRNQLIIYIQSAA